MKNDNNDHLSDAIHRDLAEQLGKRYTKDVRLIAEAMLQRCREMNRDELITAAVQSTVSGLLMTRALANHIKESSPPEFREFHGKQGR